jgi:hypothetical protein
MQDARYREQVAGYKMQVAGYKMQGASYQRPVKRNSGNVQTFQDARNKPKAQRFTGLIGFIRKRRECEAATHKIHA